MKTLIGIARFVLPVIVATALILTLLIGILWAHDVWEDRKHTAMVKSETPIFGGSGDELCGGTLLTVAQPGTTYRVRRIRYWKNCATLDVALPDGRKGHIVLGNGEVTVSPRLE